LHHSPTQRPEIIPPLPIKAEMSWPLGPFGNFIPNYFPTLGSHFSSQRILWYLQTQILHSLQISHLLLCHLIILLISPPLLLVSAPIMLSPLKIVPPVKTWFKCSLFSHSHLSCSVLFCEYVHFLLLEHMPWNMWSCLIFLFLSVFCDI
jgi:hypothetical protein